jgi:hypothetical protein
MSTFWVKKRQNLSEKKLCPEALHKELFWMVVQSEFLDAIQCHKLLNLVACVADLTLAHIYHTTTHTRTLVEDQDLCY